jgi:hypothetical protein
MGLFVWIVAAVLLGCLLLAGSGCSSKAPIDSPPVVTTAEMKSLDREAVRAMLKRLSDSPKPEVKSIGAMCYDMAPPPRRADYVCPKCGERTLYDDSNLSIDERLENGLAEAVEWEIPICRRELDELRKVAGDSISLDESQFCRKCSPKVAAPKLVLHISYQGEKTRDIEGVDHGDLRILTDFLSGKLQTTGDCDDVLALKESLPRLEELLGVKLGK